MIQRDGRQTSIWQGSVNAYVPGNALVHRQYDVAVIGGGITGLSTALALQQQGKRCVLIEAATPCYGTSGGTTAHLNTLLDTPYTSITSNFGKDAARSIAEATAKAINDIRENIRAYHIECGFREADAWLFSENDKQTSELEAIFKASRESGLDVEYDSHNPIPVPFDRIMRAGGQACFHPVKYCFGLARAFEAMGGIIVQQCRVTGIEEDGDKLLIATARLDGFEAKTTVLATHVPTGINLLHLRCTAFRSYAMAFTLRDQKDYPSGLVYDMQDPYHYIRTQWVNGEPYLIIGGEDHKTGHEPHAEKHFTALEAYARRYFEMEKVVFRWSSQYYESADGLPYIGNLPGHSRNLLVATGFGGNGMVYSHVAAHCIAELASGRDHPYPFLDPNRIKPVAGFVSFIKQNADVAAQLIKRLFPVDQLENLSDLARDEARLLRFEKETVALYKDADGTIHAIDPSCSHMKCHVQWNDSEKSWDCPCHGARFSPDGKVLNAPASQDLQQVHFDQTVVETTAESKG